MLGQEKREDTRLAEIAATIYEAEDDIDIDDKIYLMTWSPDPKELPDVDFINQHIYLVPYVREYLLCCEAGAACVESTQPGNPHYHFWYQTANDTREMARIRWIKVMQRIGNVKINTKVKHIKINRWYSKGNALHYYKQDSVGQQLMTPYNPITKYTLPPTIDYNDYTMFFAVGKLTVRKIIEKVSQIKNLEEFYKKSF